MKIVRSILEMRNLRKNISGTVGFVPTLGGLHDGHKAHLNEAKKKSDILIASSFLNPLQFSAKEDIYSYPIKFSLCPLHVQVRHFVQNFELKFNLKTKFLSKIR